MVFNVCSLHDLVLSVANMYQAELWTHSSRKCFI